MVRQAVKVGLLGLGTVGQGVVRIISDHQQDLYKETGLHVEIHKVLVQDLHKKKGNRCESGSNDPSSGGSD